MDTKDNYNDLMRAVRVHVTDEELADRRLKGLDRWDEMWDGVLHMVPAPSLEHQRLLDRMIGFLEPHLRTSGRGRLVSGINVFGDAGNYRIPDLTFVTAGREYIFQEDGVRGGAPDAVIEIRSSQDETYEKLPFYASLGIIEVIVIDRDSKRPELYRLAGTQYVLVQSAAQGWLRSDVMGVRFRGVEQATPQLVVEDALDPTTHVEI
jgi:Uma2 family endonuclease